MACPVVAGAIALLASIVPEPRRWQLLNPGAIKQVLVESAHRLHRRSAYEQGAGTMDLLGAAQVRSRLIAAKVRSRLMAPHEPWICSARRR